MKEAEEKLLSAFSDALKGEKTILEFTSSEARLRFFRLAENHKILPLVMDSVSDVSGFPYYARRAKQEVYTQAQRTGDFLLLYEHLKESGIVPLVAKGIVCRSLYPHPEQRLSSDEDLLIAPADIYRCHQAMLAYGMSLADPAQDITKAHEITYIEKNSSLYVEVHACLFPPDAVYSRLNDHFTDAVVHRITERIYGSDILTLSCQDHLLYLILHAYKHFLYSGFGIRQCADILLFSMHFQEEIDWDYVETELKKASAFDFSRAVYKIGLVHLKADEALSRRLAEWEIPGIDEMPLLEDVMASGLYGASSYSRLHSSNITLHAMSKGKKKGSGLLRSVFLPLKTMQGKYPYLQKAPYLLPYAWIRRIGSYMKETRQTPGDDMLESIRIGRDRVELLEKYHIIPDNH